METWQHRVKLQQPIFVLFSMIERIRETDTVQGKMHRLKV